MTLTERRSRDASARSLRDTNKESHEFITTGFALWLPNAFEEPNLRARGRRHAGFGYRRQYCHLQCR